MVLTLLLVANLNSTGLVKVCLALDFSKGPRDGCLFKVDEADEPFLASLPLIESRFIMLLTIFWPCCSLALYLFITSGVLATAAEVLELYLSSSGVLALARSRGTSRLVPSLLGVSLASLGLFLTMATAASTWVLRATLLGVITRGVGLAPPALKVTGRLININKYLHSVATDLSAAAA